MKRRRYLVARIMLGIAILMVAANRPCVGILRTAAQDPEKSKLFIAVDPTKTDLTPAQQNALAKVRSLNTTADVRLVKIRTNLLSASPLSVKVNVGAGNDFEVMTNETRPRAEGLTWIGRPETATNEAVLVVKDGNVTGTVRSGNELYSVRPLGGGLHALVRQDQNKYPPEHPPNFEEKEKKAPPQLPWTNTADVSDSPKVLRILVAYTPKVATARPDVTALIDVAVAETNLGYTNSHVSLRAELAYAYRVNYQESGDQDTDLANFRNNHDGIMDEVHDLRIAHKADVSVLLIDDASYCGTAAAIMADKSSAFAVVHYDCATGYYSFAHEIGHLQGARHNKEADPEMAPFSYGHGYYFEAKKWRTIMSYNCPDGCTRLPYWANPNVFYEGVPMGTETDSNDSRVLNETAVIVTAFHNP